jgi:hypothetical protein
MAERWDNEDRRHYLRAARKDVKDETLAPGEREKARRDVEFWERTIAEHADEY